MSHDDASVAQYGPTATPTPVCAVCGPAPPTGRLPHTGYDVGTGFALGALVLVFGLALRGTLRRRHR